MPTGLASAYELTESIEELVFELGGGEADTSSDNFIQFAASSGQHVRTGPLFPSIFWGYKPCTERKNGSLHVRNNFLIFSYFARNSIYILLVINKIKS